MENETNCGFTLPNFLFSALSLCAVLVLPKFFWKIKVVLFHFDFHALLFIQSSFRTLSDIH